ncbi:hypothetical protein V494_05172 [Pseudogymnoascus sp. VKM F-4513 (FW-928)]|nr:hypothetical protein V494_05172 [Pseudogymnoascus sp. VKM F-4513 (FW-928)]
MHFQLAAVFVLVPLIVAAPTRHISRQDSPLDLIDSTLEQATGNLDGTLPIDTVKRDEPSAIIGKLTEPIEPITKSLGDGLKLPVRDVNGGGPADLVQTVADTLKPVTGDIAAVPVGKRQSPADLVEKIPLKKVVGGVTGGLAGGLTDGLLKRDGADDLVEKVAEVLKPVTGDIAKPVTGKRQGPADILGALSAPLKQVTGVLSGGLTGAAAKRQSPTDLVDKLPVKQVLSGVTGHITDGLLKRDGADDLVEKVTEVLKPITGDIAKPATGKRQGPADILATVTAPVKMITDVISGGLSKSATAKRDLPDLGGAVLEALKVAQSLGDKVAAGAAAKRDDVDADEMINTILDNGLQNLADPSKIV